MRWSTLVLVASLVVLAGCGSLFADGGSDSAETLTPAPVPEVTTAPERWPGPPGVSGDGVVDPNALVAAHLDAIHNRSYVWREWRGAAVVGRLDGADDPVSDEGGDRNGTDVSLANGTHFDTDVANGTATVERDRTASAQLRLRNASPQLRLRTLARVESERVYTVWTTRDRVELWAGPTFVANYSEYADGRVRNVRFRLVGRDRPQFERHDAVSARHNDKIGDLATTAIRRYLVARNASVAEAVVDGRRHYEVVAHRDSLPGAGDLRDYTARAVVTPDGFVRSLEVSYVAVSAGAVRAVRYEFAYGRVGETTVEPPDWAAEN